MSYLLLCSCFLLGHPRRSNHPRTSPIFDDLHGLPRFPFAGFERIGLVHVLCNGRRRVESATSPLNPAGIRIDRTNRIAGDKRMETFEWPRDSLVTACADLR